MLKLSKRLNTIINLCDPCDCIVDVGTDHGFVPIALANNKRAKIVIATDIKEDPIKICKNNASLYLEKDSSNFKAIVSDGLNDIDKSASTGIVISGMGFDSIKEILKNIEDFNYNYLILSPQTKINEFIKFSYEKNLMIESINTVFEEDKVYFIFKCYNKKIWERLYGNIDED